MSAFINNDITADGRILLSKAQTGERITFTKIVMGDGHLPPGIEIRSMKDVVHSVIEIPIVKRKMNADGTAVIGGQFSNEDIQAAFFYRELGLFAKGEDGAEILYCYGNAGEFAERIAPAGESSIVEKTIDIVTTVDSAEHVTANVVRTTNAVEIGFDGSAAELEAENLQEAIEILTGKLAELNESIASRPAPIVFSPARPEGDWTIWLQDLGEVADYPFGSEKSVPLMLETAPLDAPGDFVMMDEQGGGETIINMTDNPETAGDDDIIITE